MQLFKRIVIITTIFSAVYADEKRDIILPDLSVKLLDGKQVRLSRLLEEGPLLVDFWGYMVCPLQKRDDISRRISSKIL